jgi:hypothetical protein
MCGSRSLSGYLPAPRHRPRADGRGRGSRATNLYSVRHPPLNRLHAGRRCRGRGGARATILHIEVPARPPSPPTRRRGSRAAGLHVARHPRSLRRSGEALLGPVAPAPLPAPPSSTLPAVGTHSGGVSSRARGRLGVIFFEVPCPRPRQQVQRRRGGNSRVGTTTSHPAPPTAALVE